MNTVWQMLHYDGNFCWTKYIFKILTSQHDKWNNSGTENIREEKDYWGQCKQKWSSKPTKMNFSKYDKIHIFLCICLNLLKKYLIENFIFCVVGFFVISFFIFYPHLVKCTSYKSLNSSFILLNHFKLN